MSDTTKKTLAKKAGSNIDLPDLQQFLTFEGKPVFLVAKNVLRGGIQSKPSINDAIKVLEDSIAAHGVETPILVIEKEGHWEVLDGYLRAVAFYNVRSKTAKTLDGRDLVLPCVVYQGPTDDESIRARIYRSNLARSDYSKEERLKIAIQYLQDEESRGIFRSTKWIADDLGLPQRWLTDVRKAAIETGELKGAKLYAARDGREFPESAPRGKRKDAIETTASTPTVGKAQDEPSDEHEPDTDKAHGDRPEGKPEPVAATPGKATVPKKKKYQPKDHPLTQALILFIEDVRPEKNVRADFKKVMEKKDLDNPIGEALSVLDSFFVELGIDPAVAQDAFLRMAEKVKASRPPAK